MDGVMSCFPKTMQHPTATCHGAGKADDDARRRNAGDAATARPARWWPGRQAVEGEEGRTVGTVRKRDGQPQALKRPRTAAHTLIHPPSPFRGAPCPAAQLPAERLRHTLI